MNEALSQAQYLFEKYSSTGSAELLQSLPQLAEKTFESDWLDFKSGKADDDDVKRIWSKLIGAFANSEGGVVVWGIIAKKDSKTGIDAVSGVDLVPDVNALKSRLMELRAGASDPPVANIDIQAIPLSSGTSEGFVVCLIPESRMKPHRSEWAERRFYLRMGDSSRECNVAILRQLFYPKRQLRIEASIKLIPTPTDYRLQLSPSAPNINHIICAFEIGLRNVGETSIDAVQASIECKGFTLFSSSWNNISQRHNVEYLKRVESFGSVIHPTIQHSKGILICADIPQVPKDVAIKVFARDMLPRKAKLPTGLKDGETVCVECLP